MQIPVNKTTLASALTALGKLVSRTSLIKAYQGIEIEGKADTLFFRTRNVIEQIEFRLFADLEDDFPPTLVAFEQFRQTVRNCKKKELEIEVDCGEIYIGDIKLAPVKGRFPAKEIIPDKDVTVTELPADTLSALSLLAPVADKGTDTHPQGPCRNQYQRRRIYRHQRQGTVEHSAPAGNDRKRYDSVPPRPARNQSLWSIRSAHDLAEG